MDGNALRSYTAIFRDLELSVRETASGYAWIVRNSQTGEEAGRGETAGLSGLEDAMVAAAQVARADWGVVRWRRVGEEE
ncbi:MAG TPA: hypothetical protein VKV17_21915 [Bryobacteraceae bacterium]|nr:hypothetical protein [Bryobacteraceae bacterium]